MSSGKSSVDVNFCVFLCAGGGHRVMRRMKQVEHSRYKQQHGWNRTFNDSPLHFLDTGKSPSIGKRRRGKKPLNAEEATP